MTPCAGAEPIELEIIESGTATVAPEVLGGEDALEDGRCFSAFVLQRYRGPGVVEGFGGGRFGAEWTGEMPLLSLP